MYSLFRCGVNNMSFCVEDKPILIHFSMQIRRVVFGFVEKDR